MMAELFALFRPLGHKPHKPLLGIEIPQGLIILACQVSGHKPHKPLLGIEIWVKGLDSKIN